jgi:hypothetical protein
MWSKGGTLKSAEHQMVVLIAQAWQSQADWQPVPQPDSSSLGLGRGDLIVASWSGHWAVITSLITSFFA